MDTSLARACEDPRRGVMGDTSAEPSAETLNSAVRCSDHQVANRAPTAFASVTRLTFTVTRRR